MMNTFQEICFSYSSQFFTEPQGRLLQIDEMPESISQRLAWEANRPQGDTPSTLAASWLAHSPSLSYTHSWEVLSASTLTGFGEENAAYFLHGDRRSYFSVDDSRSVTPVANSPPKLTWLSTATTDWLPCVCVCVSTLLPTCVCFMCMLLFKVSFWGGFCVCVCLAVHSSPGAALQASS